MEDFGFGGDEFLMGDCRDDWDGGNFEPVDDWNAWETEQCFQEQCAEEASKFEDAEADERAEEQADGLPYASAWRDGFDDIHNQMEM